MKTSLKLIIGSTILFTTSCTKESIKSTQASTITTEESSVASGCVNPWTGLYADGSHPDQTVRQISFIKDGVARLTPIDWSNYHTGIYYAIPSCHDVSGDTIRFEARIKNPNNTPGAVYNYDVVMQIFGSKNFSEVAFVGSSSSQQYNHIWIGNSKQSNFPELNRYFGDYETVSVQFVNKTLSIYINGTLIKSVSYDAANKIGRLKRIGCGFKGTGTIDFVRLYSSKNNTLIMKEDFDVVGKSNVIWY